MIRFEDIQKSFNNRKVLSCNFLEIAKGSKISLLGLNGSGKSTLIKILYGTLKPDSGRVFINNTFVEKAYRLKNVISYLPQDKLIFPLISIGLVKEFIKIVDSRFDFDSKRRVSSLSGGERRLLEIYSVLYSDAKIAILDEPFKGLEPYMIDKVKKCIKSSNKTIILSSHLYRELEGMDLKTILLKNGDLTEIENRDDLIRLGYLPK